MSRDAKIINAVLQELSLDERLAALVITMIERRPQTWRALSGLVAAVSFLSRYTTAAERIALAEALRDCADDVERRVPEKV